MQISLGNLLRDKMLVMAIPSAYSVTLTNGDPFFLKQSMWKWVLQFSMSHFLSTLIVPSRSFSLQHEQTAFESVLLMKNSKANAESPLSCLIVKGTVSQNPQLIWTQENYELMGSFPLDKASL